MPQTSCTHMTLSEIITAVTIHLLVPAAGLASYLVLHRRLTATGSSPVFLAQLFLLFFCYGGVLLVLLTGLFWQWSGMASLGAFFLILAAPVLLFPALLSLRSQKNHSPVHRMAFRACAAYYILLASLLCSVPILRGLLSSAAREPYREIETHLMLAFLAAALGILLLVYHGIRSEIRDKDPMSMHLSATITSAFMVLIVYPMTIAPTGSTSHGGWLGFTLLVISSGLAWSGLIRNRHSPWIRMLIQLPITALSTLLTFLNVYRQFLAEWL